MGNGASSKEVSTLVRKWERALDDMNRLVKEHHVSHNTSPTAALSSAHGAPHRSPVNATTSGATAAMRRSFASDDGISSHEGDNGPKFTLGRNDQMIAAVAEDESNFSTSLAGSPSNAKKVNRQQAEIAKRSRTEFFASYAMTEMELVALTGRTAAVAPHFCTAAVALSYLLGGHRTAERRQDRVTIEDLFFAAEIPLVYLRQRSIELEEMYSIIRTFIETDTRFKSAFTADVCHLDIAPTIGQVSRDDSHLTGDRSCKIKQDDLRRSILTDLNTGDGVYIANIDPYIVLQHIQMAGNASQRSPSLPDSAFDNTFVTAPTQQQRNDVDGIFCVVSGVREKVVSMVSLTEATLLGDSVLASHTIEVPFAALYAAMVDVGGRSQLRRPRGFIRVARAAPNPSEIHDPDGPSAFWSHELLSGTVSGKHNETSHARAVDEHIAHHLVAVAWTMHIVRGGMSDQDRYGTGLPISDVIRTVRLPHDVFLNNSMPIDQVHMYLAAYIDAKDESSKFDAELIPVICNDRPGAVPSLTQHELQAILFEIGEANADVDVPVVVMLFQYDPLIAHNVLGLSCGSQWGILTGFDQDRQVARVLDANARMFGRSWTVSTDRLHEAITGYGYIVVRSTLALLRHSRCSGSLGSSLRVGTVQSALLQEEEGEAPSDEQDASGDPLHGADSALRESSSKSTASQAALMNTSIANAGRPPIGTLRKVTTDVQQRLDVVATNRRGGVEPGSTSLFSTFAFPAVPLSVTALAAALTRTGVPTDADEVLQKSSFNCNDLMRPNMGLQAFCTVTRDFLQATGRAKDFEILPMHACAPADYRPINPADGSHVPKLTTPADLLAILRKYLDAVEANRSAVVVHFSPRLITVVGGDRPFGEFGIVTAIHETPDLVESGGGALVCVSDMHPSAFIRSWRISADDLFSAIVHRDFTAERTKGFVVLRRVDPTASAPSVEQHARSRPLWLHIAPLYNAFMTPVSPQIQALSIAFAQLGFHYSPDEIFYIAYLKLNSASPRGRRNSQANAWRDVAATLTMLSTYVTAPLMEQLAAKFLTSRRQKGLQVTSLHDISHEELEGRLQDATNRDADHLLLVTYDVMIAHGITGFGNSTAIVQSYSAERQEVDLFDAEHVSFGLTWRCKLSVLMDATCKAGASAQGEEGGLSIVMVRKVATPPEDEAPNEETLIRGTFNPTSFGS